MFADILSFMAHIVGHKLNIFAETLSQYNQFFFDCGFTILYSEDDLNKYKSILCTKTYMLTAFQKVAMTYFKFDNI